MTTSRFLRRLGFLMVLAALSVSMALPALALFDREEASGEGEASIRVILLSF